MSNSFTRVSAVRNSGLLDAHGGPEFNDIIEVVKTGLRCPVALISILDEYRQVFIAHIGLPPQWAAAAETPLTHSFCQYVVEDKRPLIINDATLHDLFKDNLAISDLGVISYLGVPVTLPDGMVIGALAAIDGQPREWSDNDLALLERIGKVASNQIGTFLSERRWSTVFEQLEEGVVIGTVVRDPSGKIVDGTYESVNPALSALVGVSANTAPGKTIANLFPGTETDWIKDIGTVVETRQSRRFTRQLGSTDRWLEGFIQAVGDDGFVITFIDVTERVQAVDALRDSEATLRLIVQGAKDYIILTVDKDHRITSWFGGAEEVFGWTAAEMIGRPVADIFVDEDRAEGIPGIEIAKADNDGVAADRRWHITADGSRVFLDGTVRILPTQHEGHHPGYIKVARNATAQKIAEDRRLALLELGDTIREMDQSADVAFAAAEIMARHLKGATRSGYGIVDPVAETVHMLPDWRANNVATLEGIHHFRDFGSFIEDLKRGEIVIISDVAADPRTSASADLFHSIGISVLVNVPIMEHGAFVGVMFVHYDKPHYFTFEEGDFVRTIADRTREAISRIRAEQEQQILNHEIGHRLKNTMAMVQAIASQTLRTVTDRAPVAALTSRLHALSKAHEALLMKDWTAAQMSVVTESVLSQLSLPERYTISGSDIEIGPRSALSLALLMHELGTNALKYGAWSNESGSVLVSWKIEGSEEDSILVLTWKEQDGPLVSPQAGKGFGSKLIQLGLLGSGGVQVDYHPIGVLVEMRAVVSRLKQS